MKFPNWFKIIWWVIILGCLSFILYQRYVDISTGKGNSVDVLFLIVWVGLAIAPIFQEISLPGVTLKQQFEDLKKEVRQELVDIRTDIANSVDVRTQVNSYYATPPPDYQLPALEEKIKSVVGKVFEGYGVDPKGKYLEILKVGDDVQFLFSARYSLEKELRRIWREKTGASDSLFRPSASANDVLNVLIGAELINSQLGHLIQEVYSVCSPAIHGEEVSKAKVSFVKDVIPELLAVLRAT